MLPYLLMVLMLIFRPQGLMGTREMRMNATQPLNLGRWIVWSGAALRASSSLPLVFTQGFALTLLSQMGIADHLRAVSYNMLLGQAGHAVLRPRGVLRPRRLRHGARAQPDRQGQLALPGAAAAAGRRRSPALFFGVLFGYVTTQARRHHLRDDLARHRRDGVRLRR